MAHLRQLAGPMGLSPPRRRRPVVFLRSRNVGLDIRRLARRHGYANAIGDPLAFTLDFDFVPLTGDEILVAGSSYAGLNGLWRAATDDYYGDRYNERRFYRRAADGGGIIYYYGDYYGWILYEYGSYPGDGPPNEHSQNPDDTADPNHEHLAPAASGYIDFNTYSPTATTVTVTA